MRENLLTEIDLTNRAKTCICNPDGVFGNHRSFCGPRLSAVWRDLDGKLENLVAETAAS